MSNPCCIIGCSRSETSLQAILKTMAREGMPLNPPNSTLGPGFITSLTEDGDLEPVDIEKLDRRSRSQTVVLWPLAEDVVMEERRSLGDGRFFACYFDGVSDSAVNYTLTRLLRCLKEIVSTSGDWILLADLESMVFSAAMDVLLDADGHFEPRQIPLVLEQARVAWLHQPGVAFCGYTNRRLVVSHQSLETVCTGSGECSEAFLEVVLDSKSRRRG